MISMKILVINTVPTEKNGITNVIFNYLEAINHQNIQMDILMINDADQSYKDRAYEYGGKPVVIQRSMKGIFSYFLGLIDAIKRECYDAVHIHGNSHTMAIELLAAKLAGCKVRITHSHNTTCSSVVLHKLLSPLFYSLYTNGLACGKEAGYWQYGQRPFTVINNGVDTSIFAFDSAARSAIREHLGLDESKILIGNVGHFWGEVKNQAFAVRVFYELFQKNQNYRLCLIGDGSLRESVMKQVEDLGLSEFVFFTGNINNVNEYLNGIDLILMPSLYEGLPLTLIEQQANGLQCICSDAITREADKTGNLLFISLDKSCSEWAKEIDSFVSLTYREERSKKAVEDIKIAGYSIQEEAKKLEKYYNNAISQ